MLNDKVVLITGGTGSWGQSLTETILRRFIQVKEIRIFSRGEAKQAEMCRAFEGRGPVNFVIGDVRDERSVNKAMVGVNVVFHLAAMKHVSICEDNPWEAVLTNIQGTQNVVTAAIASNVEMVIGVSTDKAVEPFNLYGATKACAEKLILSANGGYTKFICIRGGNVLGTSGSIVPVFKNQIRLYNAITVTNPQMTRFMMRLSDAIDTIFTAAQNAIGGELFVMKMDATSVGEIAQAMIRLYGDENTVVKIVGARPGEKIDEVLVSKHESSGTRVFSDFYFVIIAPAFDRKLMPYYGEMPKMEMLEFSSCNAKQLTAQQVMNMLQE